MPATPVDNDGDGLSVREIVMTAMPPSIKMIWITMVRRPVMETATTNPQPQLDVDGILTTCDVDCNDNDATSTSDGDGDGLTPVMGTAMMRIPLCSRRTPMVTVRAPVTVIVMTMMPSLISERRNYLPPPCV